MIEESKQKAKRSKKAGRGKGRTSYFGQKVARVCSYIKRRAFAKLLDFVLKLIGKTNLKTGKILPNFRRSAMGYVLILTVALVPLLLYGAKYVLDNQSLSNRRATGTEHVKDSSLSGKRLIKQCAQEAALEVAKKWNPALTYKQQREAMLRIADEEVYNKAPTFVDSAVVQAVHGIDVAQEITTEGKTYEPIKITKTTDTRLSPSLKQIARTTTTTDMKRYYYFDSYFRNWAPMALVYFSFMRYSLTKENAYLFPPDDDLYKDYAYYHSSSSAITAYWYHYVTWPSIVGITSDGSSKVETKSYTTRTDLTDNTVKIEVENDKIKVTTDDDVAYAVPAEQNIDIILTVPTNSATLNQYNRDKNTVTSGSPYISTSTTPTDEALSTPICQITRAYQDFLRKFFYTRGVNVGVIPYSGNISLYTNRSSWVQAPNNFVSTSFLNETDQPTVVGAMLYGTKGTANTSLTAIGSLSGYGAGCGLLCRGNTTSYKGNTLTYGDLLSTTSPSSYKFRNMVYNPCCLTDANLLSMQCEKTGSYYWMNPYFILEMNPDVKFIYGMLGAFYPYYDDRNVSNFIFIPVTWANNLLQSWSATGGISAVNTSADSTNLGRLSTPSKTTDGRKKALILVVNKPDWFEPGELTYIGFDNDFSETPAVESDEIRFSTDYSDTSKKYADGTAYNGTIQGQKKILVYTTQSGTVSYANGNYQCESATGRLSFPQKWLLKVVVAPSSGTGTITFTNISPDSSGTGTGAYEVTAEKTFYIKSSQMNANYVDFSMTNIKLISAEITNRPVKQFTNGEPEFDELGLPERGIYIDLLKQALEGKLKYSLDKTETDETNQAMRYGSDTAGSIADVGIQYNDGSAASSSDPDISENPENWKDTGQLPDTGGTNSAYSVCHSGESDTIEFGKYNTTPDSASSNKDHMKFSKVADSSSSLPDTWQRTVQLPDNGGTDDAYSVCYSGNYYVAVFSSSSYAKYSSDGINWKFSPMPALKDWYSVCYGNGKFVAVAHSGNVAAYITESDLVAGKTWKQSKLIGDTNRDWYSVCYGNGKFVAVAYGKVAAYISESDLTGTNPTWSQSKLIDTTNRYWYSVCYGNGKFVAVADDSNVAAYISDSDLTGTTSTWTQSKLIDDTNRYWRSVCYGNGIFVAEAYSSNVAAYISESDLTGTDSTWSQATMPVSRNWYSVCYGNGKFVAVAYNSNVAAYITEEDLAAGNPWTQSTLIDNTSRSWYLVCYGNGKFVAVAASSNVAAYISESDLTGTNPTWSKSTMPVSRNWHSVCYGNGKFVAVAYESKVAAYITESDLAAGNPWTQSKLIDGTNRKWYSVCYGNGIFVAVSYQSNVVAYISESDLTGTNPTWKQSTLINSNYGDWRSVCYGNGKFVAVAERSNVAAYISESNLTGTNPTWSQSGYMIDTTRRQWYSVCYGNGKFVAVASSSNVAAYITEEDLAAGNPWTQSKLIDDTSRFWRSVCYGNGKFVAVASSSNVAAYISESDLTGTDSTWTQSKLIDDTNRYWYSVCYGNGIFVAVAYSSNVAAYISESDLTGTDSTWTQTTMPGLKYLYSVCYGNGKFVAVDYYGPWGAYIEAAVSRGRLSFPDKKYGIKLIVAPTSSDSSIQFSHVSTDSAGVSTSEYSLGSLYSETSAQQKEFYITPAQISNETDDNGNYYVDFTMPDVKLISAEIILKDPAQCHYVAVVNGADYARYSSDGKTWKISPMPALEAWWSVCYGNGIFVAVACTSNVAAYISEEDLVAGKTWKQSKLIDGTTRYWLSVCYGNGKFVAVASSNVAVYITESDLVASKKWTQSGYIIDSTSRSWRSVCYGNGKFAALDSSTSKVVAYITEENLVAGKKWTQTTLPTVANYWAAVCYGNGKFVVVPWDGKVAVYISESDLTGTNPTWTQLTLMDDKDRCWNSVCYGNGKFVAVTCQSYSQNFAVYISDSDLTGTNPTWTQSTLPASVEWNSVCYGNRKFVVVARDKSVVSLYISESDLTGTNPTWSQATMTISKKWSSVCYGNGIFVAVASSSNVAAYITESDLVAGNPWTQTKLINNTTRSWRSVYYGNGKFVAVAYSSNVAAYISESDLTGTNPTWTQTTMPGFRYWNSVCYGNGKFVAVVYGGNVAAYITEEDLAAGNPWTQSGYMIDTTGREWSSVCYGNGKFVAVAESSNVAAYISDSDLTGTTSTWTQTTMPGSEYWYSVCYGDGKFVAVAYRSNVAAYITDSDLTGNDSTWSQSKLIDDTERFWSSVCYGNGKFVAVAGYNSSTDVAAYISESDLTGTNPIWRKTTMPVSTRWKSVCYGKGHDYGFFVAVDNNRPFGAYCKVKTEKQQPGWYFYSNSGSDSTNHHFVFPDYRGDMYFATNSGSVFDVGSVYLNLNDGAETKYPGTGIYRWTMSSEKMFWDTGLKIYDFKWEVKGLGENKIPLLYAGATLPINLVLWAGASGSELHKYEWQLDSNEDIAANPTVAAQKVTQDACAKLKTDWGSNLRVYLIKFRKQDKYLHKITKEEVDFDYDYLNDCATSTEEPYLYEDVTDAAGLKSALDAIYEDIKTWANRTEARNV